MIFNLYGGMSQYKEGRIDMTKCIISEYGTSGGWTNPNIQDKVPGTGVNAFNDNDSNGFYVGNGQAQSGSYYNYRSRLIIAMPSNLNTSGNKTLIIKLRGNQNLKPGYMKAHLSTINTSNSNDDHIAYNSTTNTFQVDGTDVLQSSRLYADENGTTIQTTNLNKDQSQSTYTYFRFVYNFQPSTTYYIYLLPYASNGTTISYNSSWTKWCNLNTWTYAYLDGEIKK